MRESAHKFSQKVLGEGGMRLVSTIFILLLARYLGAEDFGRYSTALAYAALCIVFVDLGATSILTREIARHPENRIQIAESSHFLKMIASLCAFLILWAVTYLLRFQPEQRFLTLCLGIVVISQTLTEYFSALLCGIEEMGWEAVLKIVSRSVALLFGFAALAMHESLHVIAANLAAGSVAAYAVSVWIMRSRFTSFGMLAERRFLKALLISSMPVFAFVIFSVLYDSQDILLLNYFHFAQRDIGWFSAAMKIMDVMRVYPVLVMGVFFPTLSKLHLSDPTGFQLKKRRVLLFMSGSLIVLAAGVFAFSPWIIRLLYKSDFMPAAGLLRLLSPVLILMGLNQTQMQMLIALNRERKLVAGSIVASILNIFLACLFLPRFGVPGACYALLGSEFAYCCFLRYVMLAKE